MVAQSSSIDTVVEMLKRANLKAGIEMKDQPKVTASRLTRQGAQELQPVDEESVTDSGYASHNSTLTVAVTGDQNVTEPLDDDNAEQLQIPEENNNAEELQISNEDNGTEVYISEDYTIRVFGGTIDDIYMTRYRGILPTLESQLYRWTKKRNLLTFANQRRSISTRLLLVGDSASSAKPTILVFCVPELRKRIQRYFDTNNYIKSCYAPKAENEPKFPVIVCCSPQLHGDESLAAVYWRANEENGTATIHPSADILCAIPIIFEANGKRRYATLGGVVKVTSIDGSWEVFGLTAGHSARECVLDDDDCSERTSNLDSDSDGESFSDSASDSDCVEPTIDPESTFDPSKVLADAHMAKKEIEAWDFPHSLKYGHAIVSSSTKAGKETAGEGAAFLDWALVPLPPSVLSSLSMGIPQHLLFSITDFRMNSPEWATRNFQEPVIVVTASRGPELGHLLPESSRILIYPSTKFVDAYMMTLDSGKRFVDGDSGAWVISQTSELLGYIVATDCIGSAYILRACDIFEDIKKYLSAQDVSLPNAEDLKSSGASTIDSGPSGASVKNKTSVAHQHDESNTTSATSQKAPEEEPAVSPRFMVDIDAIDNLLIVNRLSHHLAQADGFVTMTTSRKKDKFHLSADFDSLDHATRASRVLAATSNGEYRSQIRLLQLENDIMLSFPVSGPIYAPPSSKRRQTHTSASPFMGSDSGYSSTHTTPDYTAYYSASSSAERREVYVAINEGDENSDSEGEVKIPRSRTDRSATMEGSAQISLVAIRAAQRAERMARRIEKQQAEAAEILNKRIAVANAEIASRKPIAWNQDKREREKDADEQE